MRLLLILALTLVLLGGAGVGGAYLFYDKTAGQAGPLNGDRIVAIERGTGVAAIAALLEREGVITNAYFLKLADQLEQPRRPLKAGEFLFPAGASLRDVLAVLRDGESVARFLTLPEGLTTAEAARLINADPNLKGGSIIPPAEGSMLPETYRFTYFDTRQQVLDRTTRAMSDALAELWPNRQPDLPIKTPEEAVILASIVEKETAVAAERPRVAAVFINRLRKGMRLQSDPTVIYGITLGQAPLGRPISRADLRDKNDYNTYVIPALPPTPIANPGRDAIEAVLNPLKTNELFFVADGTGGHAFATTLREHNRNVAKWRAIERQRKQP